VGSGILPVDMPLRNQSINYFFIYSFIKSVTSCYTKRTQLHTEVDVGAICIYEVVQKSEASAYVFLYLLNASTKCNKFGSSKQQFMSNTVVNNFHIDITGGCNYIE